MKAILLSLLWFGLFMVSYEVKAQYHIDQTFQVKLDKHTERYNDSKLLDEVKRRLEDYQDIAISTDNYYYTINLSVTPSGDRYAASFYLTQEISPVSLSLFLSDLLDVVEHNPDAHTRFLEFIVIISPDIDDLISRATENVEAYKEVIEHQVLSGSSIEVLAEQICEAVNIYFDDVRNFTHDIMIIE